LTYIRGRSISNKIFIIDEAQNLTPHEAKTIITRAGENTKIIFTGDIRQIDSPYLDEQSNGLSYVIDRLKGNKLFAHVTLEKGERSELANLANELL
jgi:PhoH-like ATPase